MESGDEVKFTTLAGKIYQKKVTELHPLMDEKMLIMVQEGRFKHVFYHFHSNNENFVIDMLPKSNENLDIIQSIIHGIHIITHDDENVEHQSEVPGGEPNRGESEPESKDTKEKDK